MNMMTTDTSTPSSWPSPSVSPGICLTYLERSFLDGRREAARFRADACNMKAAMKSNTTCRKDTFARESSLSWMKGPTTDTMCLDMTTINSPTPI